MLPPLGTIVQELLLENHNEAALWLLSSVTVLARARLRKLGVPAGKGTWWIVPLGSVQLPAVDQFPVPPVQLSCPAGLRVI